MGVKANTAEDQGRNRGQSWLNAGLFLTTFATLVLEILDARLLSVLTWYHLSFLAVSLAMLGMAAGAVFVFRLGQGAYGDNGRRLLGRTSLCLALSVPVSHLLNLCIPLPAISGLDFIGLAYLAAAVGVLTVPFFLSGAVVTIALTRVGTHIGLLYGYDLLGASFGCLAIIPLLGQTDITSAALICGAVAALGAFCFSRMSFPSTRNWAAAVCALLFVAAAFNALSDRRLGPVQVNGKKFDREIVDFQKWNTYSYVVAQRPKRTKPFLWGPGAGLPDSTVESVALLIDGKAGTTVTAWDGQASSLHWIKYDVTALPYHLRRGDVAIVGVGGGRDILSAIWGENASITGVELNDAFVEMLQGRYRDFANIADRHDVALVHDEARSFLTRTPKRFDIIQMSLTDTWASTGAGAFTLSENGLYTVEGWLVFLDRLRPGGVLSVSRWFLPSNVSETSRMVSLAVATLLRRGVDFPSRHVAIVTRGFVATLLTSITPFSERDLARLAGIAQDYEFEVLAAPGTPSSHPLLNRIIASTSMRELELATADPNFDYSAPTDARPFFFNMLKPGGYRVLDESSLGINALGLGGVLAGNMRATTTLIALFVIAAILVCVIIVYPLARSGLPSISPAGLLLCFAYFSAIGAGFMMIQIPFLEAFSIFLGHPTYTLSVILFSMISFAGVGSMLSHGLSLDHRPWHIAIPLAICTTILALRLGLPPALDATVRWDLIPRCGVVIILIAPLSMLLGCCFPIGMRLTTRLSPNATAWAWGINGAFSVLASIAAVGISLWSGIHTNLVLAAALYLCLAPIAAKLAGLKR